MHGVWQIDHMITKVVNREARIYADMSLPSLLSFVKKLLTEQLSDIMGDNSITTIH